MAIQNPTGTLPAVANTIPLAVFMKQEAKKKLDAYVAAVEGEISGLGEVSAAGYNSLLIEEVHLIKQKSNGVKTVLDKDGMKEFGKELRAGGGNLNKVRLWWHSHGNIGVFWSDEDVDQIKSFGDNGADWYLSLLLNKRGEYLARLDFYTPLRTTIDGLPLIIVSEADDEFAQRIKQEVESKVSVLPAATTYVYGKKAGNKVRVRARQTRVY